MADIELGLGLDMSDVARSLARLPEMTSAESERAIIQLTKSFDKAKSEARKLSGQIKKQNAAASKSFKDMGDNAGDAESSIRAISGVLGFISPEAEKAANAIAEMGGAFEGVTRGSGVLSKMGLTLASLGPAAIAAAAGAAVLGVAWFAAAQKAELVADQIERVTTAAKDMQAANETSIALTAELETGLARVTRTYDEVTAKEMERTAAINESADAQVRAAEAALADAKALRKEARTADEITTAIGAVTVAAAFLAEQRKDANQVRREQLATSASIAEVQREEAKSLVVLAERADRRAQAARNDAQALREQAEAEAEALKAQREAEKIARDTAGAERFTASLVRNRLDSMELIAFEEQEARDKLVANEQHTQEQLWTLTKEFSERRADLRAQEAQAAADAAKLTAEEQAQVQAAYLQGTIELASAASSAFTTIVQEAANENRDAALAAFRVNQAVGLAQVAINTALSVSNVMSQWAAVPPVAAALAATAVGVGALQGAAILAEQPKFHRGRAGVDRINKAPDELSSTLLQGESVLTPAATAALGGGGVVRELNRGRTGGGGGTAVLEFGARAYSAVTRDSMNRDGSPLRGWARKNRRRR